MVVASFESALALAWAWGVGRGTMTDLYRRRVLMRLDDAVVNEAYERVVWVPCPTCQGYGWTWSDNTWWSDGRIPCPDCLRDVNDDPTGYIAQPAGDDE